MSAEPREVLQPGEAAELLGYSREVLLRECRRGHVPFRKLNARRVIFLRAELLRWLDRKPGRTLAETIDR